MTTISAIIPVYNERDTISTVLDRLATCGISVGQILVVDDGSTDGTGKLLDGLKTNSALQVLHHGANQGKGAAIATALRHAAGDIVVIQDADLEYDPADLPKLLMPIVQDQADVVFGSRFARGKEHHVAYHRQRWGNWLLTALSNFFTKLNISDMECGYKAFRRELVSDLKIEEKSFGLEPELTAKLAKKRPRFTEVSVSYCPRTFDEGKKIRWPDGLRAVYAILKYNLTR